MPPECARDKNFDLSKFTGRWYITAGLNPLFDTFPCQEHFFGVPEPGGHILSVFIVPALRMHHCPLMICCAHILGHRASCMHVVDTLSCCSFIGWRLYRHSPASGSLLSLLYQQSPGAATPLRPAGSGVLCTGGGGVQRRIHAICDHTPLQTSTSSWLLRRLQACCTARSTGGCPRRMATSCSGAWCRPSGSRTRRTSC